MTAAAKLMREIETLPEEAVAEVFDFVIFLKQKKYGAHKNSKETTSFEKDDDRR